MVKPELRLINLIWYLHNIVCLWIRLSFVPHKQHPFIFPSNNLRLSKKWTDLSSNLSLYFVSFGTASTPGQSIILFMTCNCFLVYCCPSLHTLLVCVDLYIFSFISNGNGPKSSWQLAEYWNSYAGCQPKSTTKYESVLTFWNHTGNVRHQLKIRLHNIMSALLEPVVYRSLYVGRTT